VGKNFWRANVAARTLVWIPLWGFILQYCCDAARAAQPAAPTRRGIGPAVLQTTWTMPPSQAATSHVEEYDTPALQPARDTRHYWCACSYPPLATWELTRRLDSTARPAIIGVFVPVHRSRLETTTWLHTKVITTQYRAHVDKLLWRFAISSRLRLAALMDLYIHPLYVLVSKILYYILNSPAPIHPLYHSLSTLFTVGSTCHFI
jgi:hypothetical protein